MINRRHIIKGKCFTFRDIAAVRCLTLVTCYPLFVCTYLVHAAHRIEKRSISSWQFLPSCSTSFAPLPSNFQYGRTSKFKKIRSKFFSLAQLSRHFLLAMFWFFVVVSGAVTVVAVGAAPLVVSVVAVVVVPSASKTATKLKRDSSSTLSSKDYFPIWSHIG